MIGSSASRPNSGIARIAITPVAHPMTGHQIALFKASGLVGASTVPGAGAEAVIVGSVRDISARSRSASVAMTPTRGPGSGGTGWSRIGAPGELLKIAPVGRIGHDQIGKVSATTGKVREPAMARLQTRCLAAADDRRIASTIAQEAARRTTDFHAESKTRAGSHRLH
jgi:hypothetical protein